jgi:hypothetical protein
MEKFKSHKSVMKSIKRILDGKSKPRKVMNDALKSSLIKILDKEISKEARAEAFSLLTKGTAEEIGAFLYYYHSESILVPAVLDTIKDRLVKEGKLKFKKNDNFGLICRPDWKD